MSAPRDERDGPHPARRAFHLAHRGGIARDVDEELRFHIEGRIEELVARGMTREEAAVEARRRFGDMDGYRRQTSDIDARIMHTRSRLELLAAFRRETRRAARALLRTPSFTAIALVTLALGVAATTAIWTVLEAVVIRPLPYAQPEALVSIAHPTDVPGSGPSTWGLSAAGYFHYREHGRLLDDLGVYATGHTTVVADDRAERARSGAVSASLLDVLRARPALGRLIQPADDRPGATPVAVLGHHFWRTRFGGDPSIVGRTIETSEGRIEVIGVAEPGFDLPRPSVFESGNDLAGFRVDLWLPLQLDPGARAVNSHFLSAIGRLKPGATSDALRRELQAETDRFPELFPSAYDRGFIDEYHFRLGVESLRDAVIGERMARTLWVVFAAVGLVLLIACANVANLFLVRMEARRREAAIRTALGADRAQMAMHYLSESMLLSVAAGALGLVLSVVLVRSLVAIAPADLPRLHEVAIGWTSVAFATVLASLTGIVFGVVPLARRALDVATLREGGRGLSPSPRQAAVRNTLVVAQVALALVLLASAGLMARSLAGLHDVKPGLDARGVLTFGIAVPASKYGDAQAVAAFHRDLQARLAALPGVTGVGAATGLPLRDLEGCSVLFREGQPYGADEEAPCVSSPRVTPGFLASLGIPVEGRAPEWRDLDAGTGAVVVTRALADRLWPGEDPIGRGVSNSGPGHDASRYYRVVGVVPELRVRRLEDGPSEVVFYPAMSLPKAWIPGSLHDATYTVRATLADPASLMPGVRRILTELDPAVPITGVTTMEQVVERSMARTSFVMLLLGVAAAIALVLSAVGIYGVISYVVGQRRGEIGVRIALGARVPQVAGMVVRQSLSLAMVGVVLGLAGAMAATRVLASLLYDVSPTDPLTLALVALSLLAVAAIASFAPARRAAGVDPVVALRSE
ncbi:MAG TPA: ABC transporter permease [Gemmatimonadales bacterium]